jgi:hypothetical protein
VIRDRINGTQTIVSANLVSAVDADTGEPLDSAPSLYTCGDGETCGSGSSAGYGGSTTGSAAATGGGGSGILPVFNLGLNVPALPNPLQSTLNNLILIAAAGLALLFLASRKNS